MEGTLQIQVTLACPKITVTGGHQPARLDHHSTKGNTIDAWYSGKHRDFGANIQAIMRPGGLPIWNPRG